MYEMLCIYNAYYYVEVDVNSLGVKLYSVFFLLSNKNKHVYQVGYAAQGQSKSLTGDLN